MLKLTMTNDDDNDDDCSYDDGDDYCDYNSEVNDDREDNVNDNYYYYDI